MHKLSINTFNCFIMRKDVEKEFPHLSACFSKVNVFMFN